MKAILMILFLGATQISMGAFERNSHGGRAIGMGGASIAIMDNPWAVFTNPGALGAQQPRTLSLFYSPQPFGLRELAHGSFSYVEPMPFGTLAFSGSRYGFELYREVALTLSYGGRIADLLLYGISVNYLSLSIEKYGSASTVGVDAGILVAVSDEVSWGFVATNLNAAAIGALKEKLPQVFSTGLSYKPIHEATIAADIVKDIRYEAELRLGVEYIVLDLISLRSGTSSDPSAFNAGLGIRYSLLELDYAFSSHPELGMTHQASLSIRLGE